MKNNRVLVVALSFCMINIFGMGKPNQKSRQSQVVLAKHTRSQKQNYLPVDDVRGKAPRSRHRGPKNKVTIEPIKTQPSVTSSPSSAPQELKPLLPKDIELILKKFAVKSNRESPSALLFPLSQRKQGKSGIREKTSSLEILYGKEPFDRLNALNMLSKHCDASFGIGNKLALLYAREPYSDQENKSDQEKNLVNHFFKKYRFFQPQHFPHIPKDSKK